MIDHGTRVCLALKELDRKTTVAEAEQVPDLPLFRLWYNHLRPRQNLQGLTPTEVWKGEARAGGKPRWFQAWSGVLSGFYVPD